MTFVILPAWQTVLDTSWRTYRRFPAVVWATLALTLAVQLDETVYPPDTPHLWMIGLTCAVLFSCAASLLTENRPQMPTVVRMGLPWLAGGGGMALGYWADPLPVALTVAAGMFAILAMAELVDGQNNAAAWLRGLMGATLLSLIATLTVCVGLSVIVFTIDTLFDVNWDEDVLPRLWPLGATWVLPWLMLAFAPQRHANPPQPRWLCGLMDWLLAPLVLVYAVILHVYVGLRLITWNLPEGVIGTAVSLFIVLGGLVWGAAMALDDTGLSRRILRRWFLPLMILPGFAVGISLWVRIDAYGLTEERVLLGLSTLMAVGCAGFQIWHRQVPRPTQIAIALAVASTLVAYGPWSVVNLSLNSQSHRLLVALDRTTWADPEYRTGLSPASPDDTKHIASAVSFLVSRNREDLIPVTVVPRQDTDPAYSRTDIILSAWGLPTSLDMKPEQIVTWQTGSNPVFSMNGHTHAARVFNLTSRDIGLDSGDGLPALTASLTDGQLILKGLATRHQFPLPPPQAFVNRQPTDTVLIPSDSAPSAHFLLTAIRFDNSEASPRITSISGYILFTP